MELSAALSLRSGRSRTRGSCLVGFPGILVSWFLLTPAGSIDRDQQRIPDFTGPSAKLGSASSAHSSTPFVCPRVDYLQRLQQLRCCRPWALGWGCGELAVQGNTGSRCCPWGETHHTKHLGGGDLVSCLESPDWDVKGLEPAVTPTADVRETGNKTRPSHHSDLTGEGLCSDPAFNSGSSAGSL